MGFPSSGKGPLVTWVKCYIFLVVLVFLLFLSLFLTSSVCCFKAVLIISSFNFTCPVSDVCILILVFHITTMMWWCVQISLHKPPPLCLLTVISLHRCFLSSCCVHVRSVEWERWKRFPWLRLVSVHFTGYLRTVELVMWELKIVCINNITLCLFPLNRLWLPLGRPRLLGFQALLCHIP